MMERFRLKRQTTPLPEAKSEPQHGPGPEPEPPKNDDVVEEDPAPVQDNVGEEDEQQGSSRLRPSNSNVYTEEEDPFMGLKVRRMASSVADYKGDYIDVPSEPSLLKILQRQGWVYCIIFISGSHFRNFELAKVRLSCDLRMNFEFCFRLS